MATINEKMTAIADAIRAKTGESSDVKYGLDAMAQAIAALETGGGLPVEIEALTSGVIASATGYRYLTIEHNLGVVPNFILMIAKNTKELGYDGSKYPVVLFAKFRIVRATNSIMYYHYIYKSSYKATATESFGRTNGTDSTAYLTEATAYMQAAETAYVFPTGAEYVWVCGKFKDVV